MHVLFRRREHINQLGEVFDALQSAIPVRKSLLVSLIISLLWHLGDHVCFGPLMSKNGIH